MPDQHEASGMASIEFRNKESCSKSLKHQEMEDGGRDPEDEDGWELVEASRTHTVLRKDAGMWYEWELAYPAICLPDDMVSSACTPPCRTTSAVLTNDLLDEQRDIPHSGGEAPCAPWIGFWNLQLPGKENDQEDNWSVATTCGEEPEEATFTCELCEVTLPTQRAFDDHLDGLKHKRKIREQKKQWQKAAGTDSRGQSNEHSTAQEQVPARMQPVE